MAFTLDRTKSFVRIDEPNLISIHRSTSPIVPAIDCCLEHLYDAFICAVREYNLFRVYIGLYDSQLKSNLVFVADPAGFDSKKNANLIKEAEDFLAGIGFIMELVNMNFSPATREVIMRDMKIMREPSFAVRLDAAMLAIEGLTEEKDQLIQKYSRTQKAFKAEVDKLRQQLAAANTIMHVTADKPPVDEELVAGIIEERDALRSELALIREEIKTHRSEHPHSRAHKKKTDVDQQSFDTLLKTANQEIRVLREDACVASEKVEAAKQEAFDARQEVLSLHESVRVAQDDARLAKEEFAGLLEATRKAQDEAATALAENQAARLEIQILHEAAKAYEELTRADKNRAQEVYRSENCLLQQEVNRLQREHDTILSVQSNETNALRAALAIADENLSFERSKNESALQEMDALERNAAVELKKMKKKVDSLSDEKQLLESMAAEMKIRARGEIERLQQINQSQRRAAIKKVKSLKEEMRQLSEARAVISAPLAVSLLTVDAKKPSNPDCEPELMPHVTGAAHSGVVLSNPFGFSDNAESISFDPDPALDGIPYAMLDDVVEVHRSFNKIQAAPFGKQVQNCDGFVCLVKDQEQSMMVYVVWLMKQTGEVLVCRPAHIPEGGDAVLNLVREGIGYFERVGFIMDEMIFMSEPEQRQQQIDSLPFFHKTVMECAA